MSERISDISDAARQLRDEMTEAGIPVRTMQNIEQFRRDLIEANTATVEQAVARFDGEIESVEINGQSCRQLTPSSWLEASDPVILYAYGGGYVSGSTFEDQMITLPLARAANARVIMVDYRLSPEHPYPAASIDCLAAYRGLLEMGTPPENIVVIGESCGGGLAVGALLQARDEGLPMPACFVSLTGWFDLNVTTMPPGRDPFLTPEWVRNRAREFTAGTMDLDDSRVSVCNAELEGLPHLYLQVGQFDTMAQGALRLAERATMAGVKVTMESWPEMIQGWHGLINSDIPEAREAWNQIKHFVDRELRRVT